MTIDRKHAFSGAHALHIHIDDAATAGGRLTQTKILQIKPTHIYGRMMMYIETNGPSTHWTFFGVNGVAVPNSPVAGRAATYLLSSLPRNGVNTYSFVYNLAAKGSEGFRDCWAQSSTAMPSAWACVSFELDSQARVLRMLKDGETKPMVAVQDRGGGCVAPTPGNTPWFGPTMSDLYVGAWSFHPMKAPLDVWIDDLVVGADPVPCPQTP